MDFEANITIAGSLRLLENPSNGAHVVGLTAPASVASDIIFTLPGADGDSGQVAKTNGGAQITFGWVDRTEITNFGHDHIHGDLLGLTSSDDHTQYVHNSVARTISAQHQFSPGSTQAPFTLGANAQGQLVSGLNADQLDGNDASAFASASHTHSASEITSGTFADARIAQSNVTQHEGAIDHDQLTNYAVAEHRTIQDGTISTIGLWSSDKINTELSNRVPTSRTLTGGAGIGTIGDLSADRTIGLDVNSLTADSNIDGANDWIPYYDVDGSHKKIHPDDLPGSGAQSLSDLNDVYDSLSPGGNNMLRYDSGSGLWRANSVINDNGSMAAAGSIAGTQNEIFRIAGDLRWDGATDTNDGENAKTFSHWKKVVQAGTTYWFRVFT